MGSHKSASFHRLLCCVMPAATPAVAQGFEDPGLDKFLDSLDQLDAKGSVQKPDLDFLKDLFTSSDFQSLLKVHEKVTTPETQEYKAMTENAVNLVMELMLELLPRLSCTPDGRDLAAILEDDHFNALLEAHDKVAAKEYLPQLPDIPFEVDEDETSVKIVRLVKGSREPLGATIYKDDATGAMKVARVMRGGAADRSGLIHVGDEVHEVNGVKVTGKPPTEMVNILMHSVGPITLKLVPGDTENDRYKESQTWMRALFSYDPHDDRYIPCREAGLAFQKGDILQIVSQDDTLWWQARKESTHNARAGLIPGQQLLERKFALKASAASLGSSDSNKENKDAKGSKSKFSPKINKKTKKTKKLVATTSQNDDSSEAEELFTYEEVDKYFPDEAQQRPLVLIGPPGVGRNTLKRSLLATDPERFCSTVPHTSRPRRPSELEGDEYHFISRQEMDKEIQNKKFVEFGEYKGNLYGTSMEQVRSIIDSGRVGLITPHPQAIKLLRVPEVKPYVIFVKPPDLARLRETRLRSQATTPESEQICRPFTDDELNDMILEASRLETSFGQYFDEVIINEDLQTSINELLGIVERLESEPQWVPTMWAR